MMMVVVVVVGVVKMPLMEVYPTQISHTTDTHARNRTVISTETWGEREEKLMKI